jgi:type II secretory pathway pseudopilin PulG
MIGRPDHHPGDAGASYLELLLVVALTGALAGLAVPVTAHAIDAGRARHAAGFLASRFRLARQQAVTRGASVAVLFDQTAGGWTLRTCTDGNGNGVRRAEVVDGRDPCLGPPAVFASLFPGAGIGVDSSLRGPDGEAGSSDPVRFGAGDLASFSPDGGSSAGTVYLRSAGGLQYAVRVAGATGRTRLLRYEPGIRRWLAV